MTHQTPCTVEVRPAGHRFTVADGESVMAAAERAGLYWPTVCHGRAECSRCRMVVEAGAEHVSAMQQAERQTLLRLRGRRGVDRERLACQTRTTGPIQVRRRGVVRRDSEEDQP